MSCGYVLWKGNKMWVLGRDSRQGGQREASVPGMETVPRRNEVSACAALQCVLRDGFEPLCRFLELGLLPAFSF